MNKRNDMIHFFSDFLFCRHHWCAVHRRILDVCCCRKWIKKRTNKTNVFSRYHPLLCSICLSFSRCIDIFAKPPQFFFFFEPTGNLATIKLSTLVHDQNKSNKKIYMRIRNNLLCTDFVSFFFFIIINMFLWALWLFLFILVTCASFCRFHSL